MTAATLDNPCSETPLSGLWSGKARAEAGWLAGKVGSRLDNGDVPARFGDNTSLPRQTPLAQTIMEYSPPSIVKHPLAQRRPSGSTRSGRTYAVQIRCPHPSLPCLLPLILLRLAVALQSPCLAVAYPSLAHASSLIFDDLRWLSRWAPYHTTTCCGLSSTYDVSMYIQEPFGLSEPPHTVCARTASVLHFHGHTTMCRVYTACSVRQENMRWL